jgi:hypothetical protein
VSTPRVRRSPPDRTELMRKAAGCFSRGGATRDACRCLEAVEDFSAAGFMHEQDGRMAEAARCFERAGAFLPAARCYLAAGAAPEAGRCLMAAGSRLEAGWTFAHHARDGRRALTVVGGLAAGSPEEALSLELVLARSELTRNRRRAALVVHRVTRELGQVAPAARGRIAEWALAVGETLERPDLIANLRAAMVDAGMPDALEEWEKWAMRTLGSARGIAESSRAEEKR